MGWRNNAVACVDVIQIVKQQAVHLLRAADARRWWKTVGMSVVDHAEIITTKLPSTILMSSAETGRVLDLIGNVSRSIGENTSHRT